MAFKQTTAVKKILALKKRLKIIQGGSSAGKTIAVLLVLIDRAQSEKNKMFSVVSETMPHLKRGAIRDFINIMEAHNYYDEKRWNRTNFTYTFESGTKMEFFSADSPDKVRGPRRDVLFVNECNNVRYEAYTQLSIRTNEDIYLDYNPVAEFWVHEQLITTFDHDFIILNYKDNEALPETIVEEIESRKDNKNFWQVYGLGLLGEAEGLVYSGWNIIDCVPDEARLVRRGLDFGYTNDPSAIVNVYSYNGAYVLDEICYSNGLSNKQLADILLNEEEDTLTVADSAEPKSIDEIRSYGVKIIGAKKGRDSVAHGIQYLQDQKILMTKRSVNLIKEYRNYLWKTDRNGKIINTPEGGFDHLLDSCRYALTSLNKRNATSFKDYIETADHFANYEKRSKLKNILQPGFEPVDEYASAVEDFILN